VLGAGALLAATAVALGAFGAHALHHRIGAEALGWWQTGTQYLMWSALGLVAISCAGVKGKGAVAALLGGGAILFAGSLYLMALTGARWLGAVTPFGGVAMIAAWALLARRAFRQS